VRHTGFTGIAQDHLIGGEQDAPIRIIGEHPAGEKIIICGSSTLQVLPLMTSLTRLALPPAHPLSHVRMQTLEFPVYFGEGAG